jgi:glucose-1-phosphate thymidylyltransferase
MQKMIDNGEKFVAPEIQNWFDCGKPETLLSTNAYLLNRDWKETKYHLPGSITLIAPVYIGDNCVVSNCEIGPNVTLADDTSVSNSKIKNSIIYEGAKVSEAELDEVILGLGESIKGAHKKIIQADGSEVGF